jgi:lipid A 3-O-deacylase
MVRLRSIFIALTILFLSLPVLAQARPEDGGNELQVWTGGGPSVPGGTANTSIWTAGVRYGWILTRPHGPGFLKGRFEYALDAVPLFLVFQKYNTAYGGGVNPVGLKWDFATRGQIVPYLEINGGTLFSTREVPTGTSDVNFTSAAAFGFHILGPKYAWSLEARYLHISNAGLTTPNPGINTVEMRLGFGRFLPAKH